MICCKTSSPWTIGWLNHDWTMWQNVLGFAPHAWIDGWKRKEMEVRWIENCWDCCMHACMCVRTRGGWYIEVTSGPNWEIKSNDEIKFFQHSHEVMLQNGAFHSLPIQHWAESTKPRKLFSGIWQLWNGIWLVVANVLSATLNRCTNIGTHQRQPEAKQGAEWNRYF